MTWIIAFGIYWAFGYDIWRVMSEAIDYANGRRRKFLCVPPSSKLGTALAKKEST